MCTESSTTSQEAFRLTGRGGFNFGADTINPFDVTSDTLDYKQNVFQIGGQITLDKVIRYNKPLQFFGGVGVDVGYGALNYDTVDVNTDGVETRGGQQSSPGWASQSLLVEGSPITLTIWD